MSRSLITLLVLLCVLLTSIPAFAGADSRSYVTGRFALELAGETAGWIKSLEGGDIHGEDVRTETVDNNEYRALLKLLDTEPGPALLTLGEARIAARKKGVKESKLPTPISLKLDPIYLVTFYPWLGSFDTALNDYAAYLELAAARKENVDLKSTLTDTTKRIAAIEDLLEELQGEYEEAVAKGESVRKAGKDQQE
ncbi:MAG: hypothetical protein ABI743_00910 [bacterium]